MSERNDALEAQLLEAKIAAVQEETRKLKRENDAEDAAADQAKTYMFYAPVRDASVSRCIYELDNWSRRFPGETFTIVLNTPGGSVLDGFALYDFLQELRERGHKIVIKGAGMCASMGAVLMQAADERVMYRRARMMIHEISSGVQGTASQMADDLKFVKTLEADALDILASKAKIKRATIKTNWKRKDWWLTANEALKKGFIDRIEG